MFCRLTLVGVLICLELSAAQGQSTTRTPGAGAPKPARAAAFSVDWNRLPLGDAIGRLKSVSAAEIFLDRRVDPNPPVDFTLENASVEEIVSRLATEAAYGEARLGRLFYIGPRQTTERIVPLAALRRREVAALPANLKSSLAERRRIVWPPLTEPRGLVTRLVKEHGWRVVGSEKIPHDLWAAGAVPAMALADQLTVLLAGFDRTYRVLPDEQAIEILPVDWASIQAAKSVAADIPRSPRRVPGDKQVFTLRIENQPVGKVLEQLGQRLGWKLAIDEAALRAAGRSLDMRVSFVVENADENQLLDALLEPAGLKAERDGNWVRVTPR